MREGQKDRVAGVVVLYNPEDRMIDNLSTYLNDLGRLYVVDNSETVLSPAWEAYLSASDTIEYVRFGENRGIASALNAGAARAAKAGFDWLLTMDQDSRATPDMVQHLYRFSTSGRMADQNIGITAFVPSYAAISDQQSLPEWEIVQSVITSGNLVCVGAWKEVGGWDEKLFIDSVDYDFDFRIQLAGYVIVQMRHFVFPHALGQIKTYEFFGRKIFSVLNHNHIRHYYITRNRLYINKTYKRTFPEFVSAERLANLKEFVKVFLFESNKRRKFKSMFRGYRDYHKGIWGKYRW